MIPTEGEVNPLFIFPGDSAMVKLSKLPLNPILGLRISKALVSSSV
jgi:hypothetical protein